MREAGLESAKRDEVVFLELGPDTEHGHFLVQSVPRYSPPKSVQTGKRLRARRVLAQAPEVKQQLWGWRGLGDGVLHPYGGATGE